MAAPRQPRPSAVPLPGPVPLGKRRAPNPTGFASAAPPAAVPGPTIPKAQVPVSVDPFESFDPDFDLNRQIAANRGSDPSLPPAEALRDSDRRRKALIGAAYDKQIRDLARKQAEESSFFDMPDPRPLTRQRVSAADAERFTRFRAGTGYMIDLADEHGGVIGSIRSADGRPIVRLPRAFLRRIAEDPERYAGRLVKLRDGTIDPEAAETIFPEMTEPDALRELILDMLPIVGNIRSGKQFLETGRKALEAYEREDYEAFALNGGLAVLDLIGAVSGVAFLPKLLRKGLAATIRSVPAGDRALATVDLARAKSRPCAREETFRKGAAAAGEHRKVLRQGRGGSSAGRNSKAREPFNRILPERPEKHTRAIN